MSFSCGDDCLWDGTPLRDVVRACDGAPNLAAVGINCTAPGLVPALIAAAREATDKMVIVYPNLGEPYDAETKTWGAGLPPDAWLDAVDEWVRLGAAGVGGCCRIGPATIAEMRRRLLG